MTLPGFSIFVALLCQDVLHTYVWLWLSWKSGRFRHKEVRGSNPVIGKFYLPLPTLSCIEKRKTIKRGREWSFLRLFDKRTFECSLRRYIKAST